MEGEKLARNLTPYNYTYRQPQLKCIQLMHACMTCKILQLTYMYIAMLTTEMCYISNTLYMQFYYIITFAVTK